jgi:hypothetical protein
MKKIDLESFLAFHSLDHNDVSHQLFPNNKHPRLALNRVMSGEALLDSEQISKLALLAGVDISQVYTGKKWKMTNRDGAFEFVNGNYKAILYLEKDKGLTQLFHNDSLFHESVLHSGSIALSDYLKELESIIKTR